jgi:hypothetical protein
MSDELIIDPDPTPDWSQVKPLIECLVRTAAGHGGEFLVAVGSEDPETGAKLKPASFHVHNDARARNRLLNAIKGVATERKGDNCYLGIALMKPGLSIYQKGTEADVIGVLAAVTDWDGKNDPKTRHDRLPLCPQAEVEPSPGNFQCWYFFDRPYPVDEAKPVLAGLARCTKSDHTQSCVHVFRVPGTLNWPSRKKIAKGRSSVPWRARLSSIYDESWEPISVTLDELRAAILEKYPDAFDRAGRPTRSKIPQVDAALKTKVKLQTPQAISLFRYFDELGRPRWISANDPRLARPISEIFTHGIETYHALSGSQRWHWLRRAGLDQPGDTGC